MRTLPLAACTALSLGLSLALSPALPASAAPSASAASAASAPRLVPLVASGDGDAALIEVRGGCGFGEHRGFYGGCRINHGPRGRIRAFETGLPRGCPPGERRGFYGRCRY